MSRPVIRRPRRAVAAAVALSLTVLVGCAGQQDPDSYGGAEDNFIEGCIETGVADEGSGEGVRARWDDYCRCVFAELEDNLEFSEFKRINSDLRDETSDLREAGGDLPDEFVAAYESCDAP